MTRPNFWTDEEDKTLRGICARGGEVDEAMERLGRTRAAILGRTKFLGCHFFRRLRWTAPLRDQVLKLWRDGKSAQEIANAMAKQERVPVSRNMIIGLVNRLGAQRNKPDETQRAYHMAAKQKPRHKIIDTGWRAQPQTKPVAPTPIRCEPVDATGAKHLEDLRRCDCRWPLNSDPAGMVFCARQIVEGRSYCADHLAKALSRQPLDKLRYRSPHPRPANIARADDLRAFGIDRRAS
jgi:hypothetical protein